MEYIITLMVIHMKGSGWMVKDTDREFMTTAMLTQRYMQYLKERYGLAACDKLCYHETA